MFERIAIPLDGSPLGELAVPWAVEIASAFQSEVYVISVSEGAHVEDLNMRQTYLEHQTSLINQQISTRVSNDLSQSKAKSVFMEGDPASLIIRYTEINDISLVILVSHGRSGIMPWPMGSTAARILNQESRPILFLRARKLPEQAVPLFNKVMVALDGSARGEEIIPYIKTLVSRIKSRVIFFHTVTSSYEVTTIGGITSLPVPKIELERKKREAVEYLEELKTGFPTAVECVVCQGTPINEIMKYADEEHVSLIAITSRGETKSTDWRFGAIAYKLLHSAPQPVLLVKTTMDTVTLGKL